MANRYWIGTGGNYNATANWSATSGGAGGSSVPTNADDVFFDANSGDCVVNVASVGKTIDFTGYTNTITMTAGLTISGNVTLDTGMTIAGAGSLTINTTSTYDSNGKTWPNTLILSGNIIITLAENATVNGFTTQTDGITLNSNNLYIEGNFTNNTGIKGTTALHLSGSNNQTWSGAPPVLWIANNLTINKSGGTLTISGNALFGDLTTVATITYINGTINWGSNALSIRGCNVTSNGYTWGNWQLFGLSTITLNDNATIGSLTTGGNTPTLNGNNLYITGSFTNNLGFLGTTNLHLTGTGTWSGNTGIGNNLTINTSGTITLSGSIQYGLSSGNRNLTYTAGTLVTTGSTLRFNTSFITSNGVNWGNIISGGSTVTFNDTANCNNLTIDGGANNPTLNGNTLNVNGNFTINTALVGTTTIVLAGTGTWSDTNPYAAWIYNPLTINTTGTITLSGTVRFGGGAGAFTYTAGTIVPGTSTFTCRPGTYNINSSGFTLWNYSPTNGTHTINTGTITVNNNMRLDGNTTFAGTGGWTANDLTDSTAGRTLSLKDGSTYTVTGNLALTGTNASPFVVQSSSATLRAILTLNQGANQTVQFVRATRIDSGAGQTIWDTVGTIVNPLTDTINWNSGSRPAPSNSIRMG